MYSDKVLTCADCGQEFVFSAREQEFYATRQFTEPRRCGPAAPAARPSRGDSGGWLRRPGGYGGAQLRRRLQRRVLDRGPREMFTATCSSCGKEAQVPFRPTSGKPVYCSDCFALRRA